MSRQYSVEQIEALYANVYELLDSQREELDIADIAFSYDRGTGRSRASWRRNRQFDIYLLDEAGPRICYITSKEVKPYREWNVETSLTRGLEISCLGSKANS